MSGEVRTLSLAEAVRIVSEGRAYTKEHFPMGHPGKFVGHYPADLFDAAVDAVVRHVERLTDAILDIDAHATPFGEDDDGFVSGGYLISVGCLHRALGVVGHSVAKCQTCTAAAHDCTAVIR